MQVNKLTNSDSIKFLCVLSNGVLASGDGANNVKFWNYEVTSNQLLSSYTGANSNWIKAMAEVNGQLYVSTSSQKLYVLSETTYGLLFTVTGFSKNILAMQASTDGLRFAVALDNNNAGNTFAYYAPVTASGPLSTAQLQSSQDNSNQMQSMDGCGTFFFTSDDNNKIWSWDVSVTTGSSVGTLIMTSNEQNIFSIACLNGTRKYSKLF
jgi:hypothetical protein